MADDDLIRRIVDLAGWRGPCTWRLDWPAIETALGHRLPSDYKWLCERFPPGRFGGFLFLLHPASVSDGANLLVQERSLKEPNGVVDMLVEEEQIDTAEANADRLPMLAVAPDGKVVNQPTCDDEKWQQPLFGAGQLHPCFRTDNGDDGFWIATENDPDEWIIGINYGRDIGVEPYDCSLSSLLHEMLTDGFPFQAALGGVPRPIIFTPSMSDTPPLAGPGT